MMLLSLEEKRQILNSFPELREKLDLSLGYPRYFYYFDKASSRRKIIAREFTGNAGTGYVYGANLQSYKNQCDSRGWVLVTRFTAEQLKDIVQKAIASHK